MHAGEGVRGSPPGEVLRTAEVGDRGVRGGTRLRGPATTPSNTVSLSPCSWAAADWGGEVESNNVG